MIKRYISEYFICQISKNEFSVIIAFLWIKPVLGRVFECICSQSGRSDIKVGMRKTLNWHLGFSNQKFKPFSVKLLQLHV